MSGIEKAGLGLFILGIGVMIGGITTGPISLIQQIIFYSSAIGGVVIYALGSVLEYKELHLRSPIYAKDRDPA